VSELIDDCFGSIRDSEYFIGNFILKASEILYLNWRNYRIDYIWDHTVYRYAKMFVGKFKQKSWNQFKCHKKFDKCEHSSQNTNVHGSSSFFAFDFWQFKHQSLRPMSSMNLTVSCTAMCRWVRGEPIRCHMGCSPPSLVILFDP
jgi:hypothetical protein